MKRDGDLAAVGILMCIMTFVLTVWTLNRFGRFSAHGGEGIVPAAAVGIFVGLLSTWVVRRNPRYANVFGAIIALGLTWMILGLIVKK